jgi:hypothetical protein
MDHGPCRSCRQLVVWATSAKTGKAMPLNPEPDEERGNVLVDGNGRAFTFRNAAAANAYQEQFPESDLVGSSRYLPHHASCPQGPAWQGKHRGDADAPAQGAFL